MSEPRQETAMDAQIDDLLTEAAGTRRRSPRPRRARRSTARKP